MTSRSSFLAAMAPALFVVLWSTGFIGAKLGLPYAEPFTFLALRMAITLAILVPVAAVFAGAWPGWRPVAHSAVTGVFVHAVYLGGVFYAIGHGMPAGISALVVALQPLLTAAVARAMLGETLRPIQIAGLAGGLAGVFLVLWPKLGSLAGMSGLGPANLLAVALSVVGISVGTVYQKRFASGVDIRLSTAAQYAGALVPLALAAWLTETMEVEWTGQFVFALAWLILVLSIGAVALLMLLIRTSSAAGTASLFYLVPAVTAVMAYVLFDETLQPIQLAGMVVVMAAVAVATRAARPRADISA